MTGERARKEEAEGSGGPSVRGARSLFGSEGGSCAGGKFSLESNS